MFITAGDPIIALREMEVGSDQLHASVSSQGLAYILFAWPLVHLNLRLSEMEGNRKTWQQEPLSSYY